MVYYDVIVYNEVKNTFKVILQDKGRKSDFVEHTAYHPVNNIQKNFM